MNIRFILLGIFEPGSVNGGLNAKRQQMNYWSKGIKLQVLRTIMYFPEMYS
jgi:hypothetical protein